MTRGAPPAVAALALAALLAGCGGRSIGGGGAAPPAAIGREPAAPVTPGRYRCSFELDGAAATPVACGFAGDELATLAAEDPAASTAGGAAAGPWLRGQIARTPSGFTFAGERGVAEARRPLTCEFFAVGRAFEAVVVEDDRVERLRVEPEP